MIGIIILLVLGFVLLIAELFVMMGTLKFGIVGFILIVIATYVTYLTYGNEVGNITLGISSVLTVLITVAGIRYMQHNEVGLTEVVEGRVNEVDPVLVAAGDQGVSFGDLKLSGRAMINGILQEVESESAYIDDKSAILVTRVTPSKIYVRELV